MGQMSILDQTGDKKVEWDSKDDGETEVARKTFDNATKKGFLAYKVGIGSRKGSRLHEFDPAAERIILTPPVAGG
mgnify:CR=1 FL=1